MAGTVTFSQQEFISYNEKRCHKYRIDWVGDASTGAVPSIVIPKMKGFLVKVLTKPGSPAPTSYALQLFDPDFPTLDAMMGLITGRSTTLPEQVYPAPSAGQAPIYLNGDYTFGLTGNSTASAQGSVIFYVIDEC